MTPGLSPIIAASGATSSRKFIVNDVFFLGVDLFVKKSKRKQRG